MIAWHCEWNEDIPYQDPRNSEIQMELAPDRYRFILTRPFVADPGARWIYGAAATALIGALIVKGTGQSLPDYARACESVRAARHRRDRMDQRPRRRTGAVVRLADDARAISRVSASSSSIAAGGKAGRSSRRSGSTPPSGRTSPQTNFAATAISGISAILPSGSRGQGRPMDRRLRVRRSAPVRAARFRASWSPSRPEITRPGSRDSADQT